MARPAKKLRNDLIIDLYRKMRNKGNESKATYRLLAEVFNIDHSRVYQIVRNKSTKKKDVEVMHRSTLDHS